MTTHYPYFLILLTLISSVLPWATGSPVRRPPGKCPPFVPGRFCLGIVNGCASDRECNWGERCCPTGCGKTCIKVRGDWHHEDFPHFPPNKPPEFPYPEGFPQFPPYKSPEFPKPEGYPQEPPYKMPELPQPEGYPKEPPFKQPEIQQGEGFPKEPPYKQPEIPKPVGYPKEPPYKPWYKPPEIPQSQGYPKEPPYKQPEIPQSQGYPKEPPYKQPEIPQSQGACPKHVLKFRCTERRKDECRNDAACDWGERCCDNGCQMVCTNVRGQGIDPSLKPQFPSPPKQSGPDLNFFTRKPPPPIIKPQVPPVPPVPQVPPVRPVPQVPPGPFPIPPEPDRPDFPPFLDPAAPQPYYPDNPEPIDVEVIP